MTGADGNFFTVNVYLLTIYLAKYNRRHIRFYNVIFRVGFAAPEEAVTPRKSWGARCNEKKKSGEKDDHKDPST
jgi:hypothetical protein